MDDFKQYVPLIQGLRNPGMRSRHWEMLSSQVKADVELEPSMTFGRCLELNLQDHMETVLKVAETASKEYAIENVRREDLLYLCLLLKWVSAEQAVIALGDVPVVPECQTHSAAQVKRLLSLQKGVMTTQLPRSRRTYSVLCRISVVALTALPYGFVDPLLGFHSSLWN